MKFDRKVPSCTYGQLEGLTLEVRQRTGHAAAREGLSLHEWLDRVVHAAALPGGKV